MFNNIKHISNKAVTLHKKVMKRTMLLALLAINCNCNAQKTPWPYSKSNSKVDYNQPEYITPALILPTVFAYNEYQMHTNSFKELSVKDRNKQMFGTYATGVCITLASHYIIKYCRENKVFKRESHNKFLTLHKL